ncbi:MAG: YlbF family regulator [Bacillota bacterium]
MKTLELARQLANSLAESREYQDYSKAKVLLEEHEAAKVMLDDFRKKQWELERKKLNGDKLLEPYEEELRKLAEIIGLNPYIREYLMAEFQFMQLMMEIQKIIGEAVGIEAPEELNKDGGVKNG